MPPSLRKRKTPPVETPTAPSVKKKVVAKVKETIKKTEDEVPKTVEAPKKVDSVKTTAVVGDDIDLEGFGGEIETNDGDKTTLKKLVDESKAGVILFTYPKASTPGCTTQACLFRDEYDGLTATGFDIYGLSKDSPKANTSFKTNKKLNYTLLCDPKLTLISAIGLKKGPSGTTRGVFVVNKSGKVLLAEPGSPSGSVEAVKALIKAVETK